MLSKFTKSKQSKRIFMEGLAERVVFFYPSEEGTYLNNVYVTLLETGIVHLKTAQEEITTHLKNCEILWRSNLASSSEEVKKNLHLLRKKEDK